LDSKMSKIKRYFIFVMADVFSLLISLLGAVLLRFDLSIPSEYASEYASWIPVVVIIKLGTYGIFKLYKGMYRYTSLGDVNNIIKANLVSSAIIMLAFGFFHGFTGFPRSLFIIDMILATFMIGTSRIIVRVYYSHFVHRNKNERYNYQESLKKTRLLLIGAGRTGEKIAREILTTPQIGYQVVGFLDDDFRKRGATIHGLKVFGTVSQAIGLNLQFDEFLITAPSATGSDMRRIVEECKNGGKPYKTVPDLSEIIDDNISVKMIREVSYVDLLGRDEIKLDTQGIKEFIRGKRVLVTGAGGSIGSNF